MNSGSLSSSDGLMSTARMTPPSCMLAMRLAAATSWSWVRPLTISAAKLVNCRARAGSVLGPALSGKTAIRIVGSVPSEVVVMGRFRDSVEFVELGVYWG